MKNNESHRPAARIEAVERAVRHRSDVLPCVLGRDLIIDPEVLSAYCFQELSPRIDDLVLLAGVVAFADRCIARRPSEGWGRDLEVSVPVHEPSFWRKANVLGTLIDALDSVTGDRWSFEFRPRKSAIRVQAQAPLSLKHGSPPVVMPYSDGLDSLAGARLFSAQEPNAALILVTTGSRKDTDKPWRNQHLVGRRHRVAVPLRISDKRATKKFREPSYRSRGFVYCVMAGIAAHLSGGCRIVISESGQGALGPWLAPVGNEAPDIRTHPGVTMRVATFLKAVLGTKLVFEHPGLWLTKGQTLHKLADLSNDDAWSRTRSCARDARHMHFDGALIQCGVCASCLLRRQSLHAANLNEDSDKYFWCDLRAATLEKAAVLGGRPTSKNDERQAVCGALALMQLADLADDKNAESIAEAAFELASVMGEEVGQVAAKLGQLVRTHRHEWLSFIDAQGPNSFLAKWTAGLRC